MILRNFCISTSVYKDFSREAVKCLYDVCVVYSWFLVPATLQSKKAATALVRRRAPPTKGKKDIENRNVEGLLLYKRHSIYMIQGVSKQQIMGWASVDKEKFDYRPNTTVMNAKLSQQKYRP